MNIKDEAGKMTDAANSWACRLVIGQGRLHTFENEQADPAVLAG